MTDWAPAKALLELAFNQAINSFRSFAGRVILTKRMDGGVTNGATGAKSFMTSY